MKKRKKENLAPKKVHRHPLSRKKKILFTVITFSIPLLFLILLEVFLRIGNYRGDLNLFIYPDRFEGKYGMLNHHYHVFFSNHNI